MPSAYVLKLDPTELARFLDGAFTATTRPAYGVLDLVAPNRVRMRLEPTCDMLRPGDLVSGPALMGFADVAAYALVLAHIGPVAMAVTTGLNIAFLGGCRCRTIFAEASFLKLGRRIATVDVRILQDGDAKAQATVVYTIPGDAARQASPS